MIQCRINIASLFKLVVIATPAVLSNELGFLVYGWPLRWMSGDLDHFETFIFAHHVKLRGCLSHVPLGAP